MYKYSNDSFYAYLMKKKKKIFISLCGWYHHFYFIREETDVKALSDSVKGIAETLYTTSSKWK